MHNISAGSNIWIVTRDGLTGKSFISGPRQNLYMTNTLGYACYDLNGVLTEAGLGANNYFSLWIYAMDLHTGPDLVGIVGRTLGSLATIEAEVPPDTSAIVPGNEAVLIYQVIMRGRTPTWVENKDYRLSKVTSGAASSETDPIWNSQ